MTNYGPPLRFKAISGNGREIDRFSMSFMEIMQTACLRPDVICTLYQSTGHTDANGVEVFFGDVVKCGSLFLHVNGFDLSSGLTAKSLFEEHEITAGFLLISASKVIGNIHHSREELERRAKEVRGDE